MKEAIFDHERLDVYRLSIDYVAFSYALTALLEFWPARIVALAIRGFARLNRFR